MTPGTGTSTRRRGLLAIVAAIVLAALVVASASAGAAVGSASSTQALGAAKPRLSLGPRVLPELELRPQAARAQAARMGRPPVGSSDGGLLLDRGVFRPLPDVPGALQTVHVRNNNRGQIAGVYADDSDGTPRIRGFLMKNGRVARIDVPGAMATAPFGINDLGQVVGGWVAPDATVDPVTGETGPVHGFVWDRGRHHEV